MTKIVQTWKKAMISTIKQNEQPEPSKLLFPLGQLVITKGALKLLDGNDFLRYIARHATGDWGDLDAEDKFTNDESVKLGERILSAYTTPKGKIWIITERDRSVTTILLPEEY